MTLPSPELRIRGDRVSVRQGRKVLVEAPLGGFVERIARGSDRNVEPDVLPRGTRLWWRRGDAVAVAVEVGPQARTVRWLADDSEAPFGRGARYRDAFLSFPYIVLLLVFRDGSLTGLQQLYYRTDSLDAGEELLLPNLYNVAEGYGQRCWLCLAKLGDLSELPSWSSKIAAVGDHVFSAAFNQSSERHEGNSYWGAMKTLDPRVKSVEAWEAATRENAWVALDVKWKPAGVTASAELRSMLDRAVAPASLENATDLAGLVAGAGRKQRRR
jgi:hypothetical protein